MTVKGNRKSSHDIKEIAEPKPEFKGKNRSAVIDAGVGEAVMLHHHIDNYFCKSGNINCDFKRFIMHYFCQIIDNDKNWVIIVAFSIVGYW